MKYEITQQQLTDTIEALRDHTLRLEAEAAALARLISKEAVHLAQERLEQAKVAEALFDFYVHL